MVSAGGVPTAFVFKTISDQYGKYSFVKVLSGSHHAGYDHGQCPHRRQREAGPPVYHAGQEGHRGSRSCVCGDIGAIAKMDKVKTGDTLCDSRKVVALKGIPFAEPCYLCGHRPQDPRPGR